MRPPSEVCLSALRREVIDESQAGIMALARRWKGRIRVHLGCADETGLSELEASGVLLWSRTFDLSAFYAQLVPARGDGLNR